jgi:hypothetical protein
MLGANMTLNRTAVWIVVTSLMAAALSLFGLLFFPSPDPHPSQALVRVSTVKSVPLRLEAKLDRNRLDDGAPDHLQVTVANGSALPVSTLHLAISAPGFALDQKNLPCKDENDQAVLSLQPHRSCRFDIDLTPAALSGTYGITLFLHWNFTDISDIRLWRSVP